MKLSIVLSVAAALSLSLPPTLLGFSDTQEAFAQSAPSTCPSLRILAIFARDRAQWIFLSSDRPVTMPVTVELTTDSSIVTYAVSVVVFDEPLGGSAGYRSPPVMLANPLGTILSVSARSTIDGNPACPIARRDMLARDDQGVFVPVPLSREDMGFNGIISRAPQSIAVPLAPNSRRTVDTVSDCSVRHRDAKTTLPRAPAYTGSARAMGAVGIVMIRVSLSPTGAVTAASVYRSSGDDDLDQASMMAAVSSTYSPEIQNCVPVAGSYIFRADFNSQ